MSNVQCKLLKDFFFAQFALHISFLIPHFLCKLCKLCRFTLHRFAQITFFLRIMCNWGCHLHIFWKPCAVMCTHVQRIIHIRYWARKLFFASRPLGSHWLDKIPWRRHSGAVDNGYEIVLGLYENFSTTRAWLCVLFCSPHVQRKNCFRCNIRIWSQVISKTLFQL